jgi:hypothetical protein
MALRPAAKKRKRENRKEAGKSSSQAVGIGVCKPKQRRSIEQVCINQSHSLPLMFFDLNFLEMKHVARIS